MRAAVVLCLVTVFSIVIAGRINRKAAGNLAQTRGSQSEKPESGGSQPEKPESGGSQSEKPESGGWWPTAKENAAKFGADAKEKAAKLGADALEGATKLAAGVRDAVNERLDTAKAGKKLLDDGGDPIAELIIAKKISRDAVNANVDAKKQLDDADSRYLKAAAKLAALAWGTPKIPTGENIESVDYAGLTDQYKARAAALENLQLMDWSSTAAEMSGPEEVALLLLRARRQDMSSNTTLEVDAAPAPDATTEAEEEEDAVEELPWHERWAAKVKSTVDAVKKDVHDRVDRAKAGKQILDDGGAEVEKVFVVKKCSLQAVDADTIVWKKMQVAHDKYLKAAEKLDAAFASIDSPLPADVAPLDKSLPDQYRARAEIIKTALDAHSTPPPSPAMSGAEMDAMTILMAKSVTGISCSF